MQDLLDDAANFGAVIAAQVVYFCFNGAKTLEQSRAALKKWNHENKWKLPTRKLGHGHKQVAVVSPSELEKVLQRCCRGGAPDGHVRELQNRLGPALGGAGPSQAQVAEPTASGGAVPSTGAVPNTAPTPARSVTSPPMTTPHAATTELRALYRHLTPLWGNRAAPAQAGIVVHGVLQYMRRDACQALVRKWVQAGDLRLGTAMFPRARGSPVEAFAVASIEDLAEVLRMCRRVCAREHHAAMFAGIDQRVQAALVESEEGTDFQAYQAILVYRRSDAQVAALQAEVARLEALRTQQDCPAGAAAAAPGTRCQDELAPSAGQRQPAPAPVRSPAQQPAPSPRIQVPRRGRRGQVLQQQDDSCVGAAPAREQPPHIRHPNGLWARSWQGHGQRSWGIARWVARWLTVRSVLTLITACALCGYGTYPVSDELGKWVVRSPPTADSPPPYSLANYLHPGPMAGPDGTWLLCPTCGGTQQQDSRLEHVVFSSPEYIQDVVRLDPSLQMLLALANVGAGFAANAKGYFTAGLRQPHAVGAAMLTWDASPAARAAQVPQEVQKVLAWSVAFNPLYRSFLSVLEQHGSDTPGPFLQPQAVAAFAADVIARSPLAYMLPEHERTCYGALSAVMPAMPPPRAHRAPPTSYTGGVLHPRGMYPCVGGGGGGAGSPMPEVTILPDGSAASTSARVMRTGPDEADLLVTAELAIFPYLFPFATGAFGSTAMTLVQYLLFRARSFLSVWTLVKPYLLLMFTIRTTMQLHGSNQTKVVLERAIAEYRKQHPDASDAKILKHVIKYSLPATMPNTPSWHRRNLQDLLALVDRWGMPTHFLTLTADEFSPSRWEEVECLEDMLKRWCSSFTWRDAPAENAFLFHKRLQLFMRNILKVHEGKTSEKKDGRTGVLGRVLHHVTRYEVQMRQSLHAHILLWVHPDDVERVTSEIIACVPGKYVGPDGNGGDETDPNCPTGRDCWEGPTDDPYALELYDHVMSKQVHHCTPMNSPGCRKQGPCRYGFPWKPHNSPTPILDPETRRYVYYRPTWAHRNVSPYHPTVALLWGAHMNLQRVTSTDWSFYVLKYAMKAEPCGKLNLDDASRVALGLPEDPPDTQFGTTFLIKLISAYLTSTVISPTLAFLSCAQIGTVYMSSSVDFVCSAPPSTRTRTVHFGSKLCACPVDIYSLRPDCLQDVTFASYFRDYRLVSVKAPRARRGRPPQAAAAAMTTATALATGAAGAAAAAVAGGGLGPAAVVAATAAAAAAGAGVAQAAGLAARAAAQQERAGPVLRQAPPGSVEIGLTQCRQHRVYKLREPRIVRFSDFNPAADPEGYFYNLLLREEPFRKEADLLSPDNMSRTYFEECRLRGLVQNTSDLEVHLQSYANYHLYNNQRRQSLLAALLGKYVPSEATDDGDELNPEAASFTVNYGNLREPRPGAPPPRGTGLPRAPARADAAAVKAALAAEFADLDAQPYTEAQAAAVEAIVQRGSGVVVLTGGPGSGKTFTTKKLTRQLRQMGKSVLLTASTGAAAVRLSGFAATNHSAFDLPVGRGAMASWVSGSAQTHPKAEALRQADVFIIDEFSMITDVQLSLILTRIFHASPYQSLDDMLAKKLIILVGDHAQLPPVCHCRARDSHAHAAATAAAPLGLGGLYTSDDVPLCETCHICSNPFFQAAPKYKLPASVRHARDPEFAAFLDIIRTRRPTQAELDAVFGEWQLPVGGAAAGMYITEEMVPLLADDRTTVLCTHVEDAKSYNHAILDRLSRIGALGPIHACPLRHDVPPRSHAEAALQPWLLDARFRTIEQVAVGARVVLVENCDLHRGAANGAAGVVEALQYATRDDGRRMVSGIKVRLLDSGKRITIGARTSEYNWFSGVKYSKHAFPLTLGWAITAHRAQGATLAGPTIIHARSVFTPGQMYVMLSRVTERTNLRLVGPLSPALFTPVQLPHFVAIDALADKQRGLAAGFVAAAAAVLLTTPLPTGLQHERT